MFKYKNSGIFVNEFVDYPFNITDGKSIPIKDFWEVINKNIRQINDENMSKIRYIWIDACNYCQTEIFLKKILLPNQDKYPILYLHWIDFINKDKTIYHQLSQEQIDGQYFINNANLTKICVIDHAETINQIDQYFELCKKLHDNKCIFIFVCKKELPEPSFWKEIVKRASRNSNDDNNNYYLGILRSEDNYFVVRPYTILQCENIFRSAILKDDIKNKAISISNTLEEELRKPYYFDFLISELNSYNSLSQMPNKLDDSELILKIFDKSLDGIVAHLKGHTTFRTFLDGYYNSSFVKTYNYGEHSRIPFDNYVWAYGIIYFSANEKHDDIISTQFNYSNEKNDIDYKRQLQEINERVIQICYSEKKKTINKNFILKDYFIDLINFNIEASKICAFLLNKCFDKIDIETSQTIFKSLGERYNKTLNSKEEISTFYSLGMEIGMLLPKISDKCIGEGLNYLFNFVNEKYVEPKCNDSGISVIPVTNFEFKKFVDDGGYSLFYSSNSDKPLNDIATEYYKEIFDFIINALSGNSRMDSNCLARLLKGYGWDYYKQVAYLFSKKEDINNAAIYQAIGLNYPHDILYPAKWSDSNNSNISRPFCNPLQPVVCINLFEARAYTKWLSSKIQRNVRILNYDPDYLSIIGNCDNDVQRQYFISHIKTQHDFINSIENESLFYGANDIKVKEPFPVAMPNSKFEKLYDFVGNIFETQDTPFTYKYDKSNEIINGQLKQTNDIFIDYNCPGGGLQRTEANWPPEYMGQVPAFLRNQDIGFRIVIESQSVGSRQHKSRKLDSVCYSKSTVETFSNNNIDRDNTSLFKHIHLKYIDNNDFEKNFMRSKIFFNADKSIVIYSLKNTNSKAYTEAILLVQNKHNIFAYHLVNIVSVVCDTEICDKTCLKIFSRKPTISDDMSLRKKMQNYMFSDWIDMIELTEGGNIYNYIAFPINIVNGFFQITNRRIRYDVRDGQENKGSSLLNNSYIICFNNDSQNYKKSYYESLKDKLGANFFLPDWINIVDFIRSINIQISDELDIETVIAAISTIDTSDLHEQINLKKRGKV